MPPIPEDQVSPFGSSASEPAADERYLNAQQVRRRYGEASDMWIWRRLHDDSKFPRPTEICGRRFWKLSELVAWEQLKRAETK
jgi:predicted DNA-binding transcriptional regulator AlpA